MSSRYSLIRSNVTKNHKSSGSKPECSKQGSNRTVLPPKNRKLAARTVVVSGSSMNRRTVLKPSQPQSHLSNISMGNNMSPNTHELRAIVHQTTGQSSRVVQTRPKASSELTGSEVKPNTSRFVWVNKNMLPEKSDSDATKKVTKESVAVQSSSHKSVTKTAVDKKNSPRSTHTSQPVIRPTNHKHSLKALGKYKLVSSNSGAKSKSPKFTIRTRANLSPYFRGSKAQLSPYVSKSGKRIISRYKIRRRSIENKITHSASPRLKKSRKTSPYKVDHRKNAAVRSKYKIDRVKGQRKTLDIISKAQTPDRRSYKWVKHELRGSYQSPFVSPFKLLRRSTIITPRERLQKRNIDKNWIVRKIASRSIQKSAAVSARAKYKKNNTSDKHCLFYMRFGKCKRGDKCFYIHDADRVAVCTRYLRGTCDIENCLFSHEARKEKVPVCQHFMRGCCLRDNCPYLHVNVGKNAPICKSFAEYRYCYLGEKCKKLHTDICPNRDSEGKCPKGRKCRLRHPKKAMRRVPKQDNTQLSVPEAAKDTFLSGSAVVDDQIKVPRGEKLTEALPAFISLNTISKPEMVDSPVIEVKKLKNKPNFL